MQMMKFLRRSLLIVLGFLPLAHAEEKVPVDLGSRVEMFVDTWLVDSNRSRGVSLKLQTPIRREVVLTTDKPWEGKESAYFTVFQDGPRIRLYYRGYIPEGGDASDKQVTCYAESNDGITFTRPNLGLYEFNGSKENNIVYMGVEAHNFAPFLDANPKAKPDERYKAVGGLESKLFGFISPDGVHWKKVQSEPVMTKGQFDSLNIVFWDEQTKVYRCYSRTWTGGGYNGFRAVQSSTSEDFLRWNDPVPNRHYAADGSEPPQEHFYTSATTPCPDAPHHRLSFPMRFIPDRTKPSPIKDPGMSDAVFLSSRDGTNWDRSFLEAWIRPGLDERNWTHRNNMPARGIVQTSSNEFSMYISEHYAWPDNRLRRLTIRRHGFASMHADHIGGEFTTRPLTFTGKNLLLNYATSAAGSVQVEIQDEHGKPLPGFSLAETDLLFGDELEAIAKYKSIKDLSALIGKPVRLRFVLKDADVYSLRFR
ncbi:MAG: hypothetical protein JWM68_3360 [Verrucomicrobiales bacterium]|nr:hypothetical protein [Verrucomicrobiales bacterium]